MGWILLGILAQASVSVANFTDKIILEKYIKDSSVVFLFSGATAFIVGLVIWIWQGFPVFPPGETLICLLAGVCLQFYLLPYFKALDEDDPSKVLILFQLVPVFTLIMSWIFLHESISGRQLIGFGLLLISGILVSSKAGIDYRKLPKSFWLMVISCLLFASSLVLFKFVVDIQTLWDSLAYEGLGMGLGVLLTLLHSGFRKKAVKVVKHLIPMGWLSLGISEFFYIIYRLVFGIALSLGPASLVSVMEGVQPVILLIYGVFLTTYFPKVIEEDISIGMIRKKLIAIVGVFVGLYLVYV
jgi:uncharacterized membrane protein